MVQFSKQFLFMAIAVVILAAGGVGIWAVNNRGDAPALWLKMDEGQGAITYDASGNSNNGTITNATWQNEEFCKTGKCLYFDGVEDKVDAGDDDSISFSGEASFSVSAWIKPTSVVSDDDTDKFIAGQWGGFLGSNAWFLKIESDDSSLVFSYSTGDPEDGPSYELQTAANSISLNEWGHIYAIKSGSNLFIYKNGILIASDFLGSGVVTDTPVDINVIFGAYMVSVVYMGEFSGFIDEAKIYNYARTASQVKADFVKSAGGKGAVMSVGSSQEFQDADDGLVGYWKMDEASWDGTAGEVVDSSGNGNNGTAVGGATKANTTSTAKFGMAGSFDGTDDYVDAGNVLNMGTSDFTISFWMKAANAIKMGLVSKRTLNYEEGYYLTTSITTGNVNFGIEQVDNTSGIVSGITNVCDNNWHLITAKKTSSTLFIYVDGALNNSASHSVINSIDNASSLVIGRYNYSAEPYFNGQIDDVKIYNKARTAEQIRRDYETGPPPVAHWRMDENTGQYAYDVSGSNNGTLGVGATADASDPVWTGGKYGSALKFDGVDDYVGVADNVVLRPGTNDYSFSSWVKIATIPTDYNKYIFNKGTNATAGQGGRIETYIVVNTGRLGFLIAGGVTGTYVVAPADGASICDNKWHYVSVAFDRDGNATRYVDGIQYGTAVGIATENGNINNTASFYIGAYGSLSANYMFPGLIDDVRIYNYARTPKQILEDMNAGHPAVGSPVGSYAGYWKFDEMASSTVFDQSINKLNGAISGADWSANGKFGGALDFVSANSDYVQVSDNAALDFNDAFTISVWAKPDGIAADKRIIYRYDSTSQDGYMITQSTSGSGAWQFSIWVSGSSDTILSSAPPSGNWQHIVGVREVDGTMKIYIDGVLQADTGSKAGAIDSSDPLYFGQDRAGVNLYDGLIDEVKIYPFALSPAEIKLEYNRGSALKLGSPGSQTSSTSSDSALLEYCVPGSPDYCAAPVGHWRMDEKTGQYANDVSGSGNTGTLGTGSSADASDATWKSSAYCKSGACLSFDGVDDYVSVATITNDTITMSAWIKTTTASGEGFIIANTLGTYSSPCHAALGRYINNAIFRIGYISTAYRYIIGTKIINDGNWHYIVGISDENGSRLYVDGVADGTSAYKASDAPNPDKTRIGVHPNTSGYERYFNGLIDDVRIYNYARTPAQIAWDYNRGAPIAHWQMNDGQDTATTCNGTTSVVKDSMTNLSVGQAGNPGRLVNPDASPATTSMWSEGKYGCGISFDGVDDYVSVGNGASLNSAKTISAWIKTNSHDTSQSIFQKKQSDTGGQYYNLSISSADNIAFYVNGAIAGNGIYSSADSIVIGSWHHVVGTYDGSVLKLYIDGVSAATNVNLVAGDYSNSDSAFIGVHPNLVAQKFNGLIDDVRIYNYALTATQVKTLFNQGAAVRFGPVEGLP